MTTSLVFQSTIFDVINRNNQPWIRGYQIGSALGYTRPDVQVAKLFKKHADEFTNSMTAVVTLPTPGGPQETRIFSLRGCHLLAMFARTSVAKAFRVWVLDVLESLQQPQQLPPSAPLSRLSVPSDPERKELTATINAGARSVINAHFGVKSVNELTVDQVKQAIALVHEKIRGGAELPALPTVPLFDHAGAIENKVGQLRALIRQLRDVSDECYALVSDRMKDVNMHPARFESTEHSLAVRTHQCMNNLHWSLGYIADGIMDNARIMEMAAGLNGK